MMLNVNLSYQHDKKKVFSQKIFNISKRNVFPSCKLIFCIRVAKYEVLPTKQTKILFVDNKSQEFLIT